MRLVSWNVNGLRAAERKGFLKTLDAFDADVVGIQEVRASEEQLSEALLEPDEHYFFLSTATSRKGYSGVGLYSRYEVAAIETSMGEERFDIEGRLQLATIGELHIANVYFPNGSGTNRNHGRVPYKLAFYRKLFSLLAPGLKRGERWLVMGDFNTAHEEIDLARPKQNQKTSGFLPKERQEFSRWLAAGWVDTFRHLHPDAEGHYTWWSQRGGARARNVGWRIDYILASPGAMPYLTDAFICPEIMGSDHCPLGVVLDDDVLV